jgi:hypothetical protein
MTTANEMTQGQPLFALSETERSIVRAEVAAWLRADGEHLYGLGTQQADPDMMRLADRLRMGGLIWALMADPVSLPRQILLAQDCALALEVAADWQNELVARLDRARPGEDGDGEDKTHDLALVVALDAVRQGITALAA